MKCVHCSTENDDTTGTDVCTACGKALARTCIRCGRRCPLDDKFCSECGQDLHASPSVPAEITPRGYTPKHLADKILRSRSALDGARKQVTVFFADVKGSLDLSRRVDAEEWHRVLDRFFAILTEGVHRYEGTINQYTGDGVMALFGAPIAHEDHAQRACYAALYLRQQLRQYAVQLRRSRKITFAVRMGLNSGDVVVGRIGDDLRMDYTAQGHAVGLAARMEQLAGAGTIYLTSYTADLVSGYFEMRDLGRVRVKGVKERIRHFALVGETPQRTRVEVSRARGFSPFVGRVDETASLQEALDRALSGYGQIVSIVGTAGVGKSRLCLEFAEQCRARGITVAETHCPSHGRSLPLHAAAELLRSYFGIGNADRRTARARVAAQLRQLGRGFRDDTSFVLDLLGVPQSQSVQTLTTAERHERLQTFGRRLVQSQSRLEPLVLLVDDAHWIDAESDALLAHLAEAVGWTRTLLLLNFRPEYRAAWMNLSYCSKLALPPLSTDASDALLAELLRNVSARDDLHVLIRERAAGNPFFLEEIVRSLIQQGLIARDPLTSDSSDSVDVRIPSTVQALLSSRIDRLQEPDQQVLLIAAVMGRNFSAPLLQLALQDLARGDQPPPEAMAVPTEISAELSASLDNLIQAELVESSPASPREFGFVHPLTQEVAYQVQLQERRRRVHEAVARAIEALYATRLGEHAALIAHHWSAAGRRGQATAWRYRAALRVTNIQTARPYSRTKK